MKPIGKLHVLTDFTFQQRFSHEEQVRMAVRGGADTIQFRQKHGSLRDILAGAAAARSACEGSGVTFLVNDRIDIALAVGADGVHLGQLDMPALEARNILGPNAIIGVTTPDLVLANRAFRDGADYVGFGPVFPTRSKANPTKVQGISGLERFCKSASLPVIAIAGITVDRISDVMGAGAHGVAVMTAVSRAENPENAVRMFSHALRG